MYWLMKVFQNIETLPVLLNNFFWTREQTVEPSKHNILTHFPKDRNCEICQRTKITKEIGDMRITKSSAKDVNLDIIIDLLSWHKT